MAQLTQAIQEQRDAIRDMEIDLRNTVLQAILDREALNKRMLQGRIDVENEILNIVTRNYEKERDQILETSELKIAALNDEIRLLDEQLAARKKLAEREDKQAKLAQLEAQ